MNRYESAHSSPQGAGDARPTALQIIHDESLEGKLAGKSIVLTGGSAGIGIETARALSATGATLIITVRDTKKGETALNGILDPGRVSLVNMDNTSLTSVRAAAATILARSNNQVNILINNAGVMGIQTLQLTEDGHEITFQTNHLSHFLLFQLLKQALLTSSTPTFNSRVINISSSTHRVHDLPPSHTYNFQNRLYDISVAYSQSKLANIYMTNELERRYSHKGVHGLSLHPGAVHTEFGRHMGPEFMKRILGNERIVRVLKSSEQGAATSVFAAVGKEWEGRGGRYLVDCGEARAGVDDGSAFETGWVPRTFCPKDEDRLWKDSLRIVGIMDDM